MASRYSDGQDYEHFPDSDDSLAGEIVGRERKKEKCDLQSTEQRAIPRAYVPPPDSLSMLSHQSQRRITRATPRDQIPPRDLSPEKMNDDKRGYQILPAMLAHDAARGPVQKLRLPCSCERLCQHAKPQKEGRLRGLTARPPASQDDFTIRNTPGGGTMEFEQQVRSADNTPKAGADDEVTVVLNKATLPGHVNIFVVGHHGEDRLLFEVDTLRCMDCGDDIDAEDMDDRVKIEEDSDGAIEIMDRLLLAPTRMGKSLCSG